MTTAPLTGLLDKQTSAQYACVSVRTLDRWIQSGLPVYRHTPRSKVLLKSVDVEAFRVRERSTELIELGRGSDPKNSVVIAQEAEHVITSWT